MSMKKSYLLLFCLLTISLISGCGENLGEGYSRKGEFIYYKGKRIDKSGANDISEFAVIARRKLTLCSNVDAASFEVLSQDYTKDKNKVYYKWISGSRFWVVEVPGADSETFEVLGLSLARDKNHVYIEEAIVQGADSNRVKSIFGSRIWLDTHNVWNDRRKIEEADPETFERIGKSEFGYYRDSKRVYSYFGRLKVVEGADPKTFKSSNEKK